MKQGLIPGLTLEQSVTVTPEMGVKHFGAGVAPVLSSPSMISLMERTCVDLLTPYMEAGEQSVGFHVDVKHFAPTRSGQGVTIKAALLEAKDNKFRFAVEAANDQGVKIGSGTHRRALIRLKQFAGAA